MSNYTNQIVIYGTNDPHQALFPVNGRPFYECANTYITRGMTPAPNNIDECLKNYPEIKEIADAIGFTTGDMWEGNTACPPQMPGLSGACTGTQNLAGSCTSGISFWNLLLPNNSTECKEMQTTFGWEWMGCLWGTPNAPYSCICPQVNAKYEAYIKLRLNDASFWATPVETPVKRAEFLDAFKYGKKVNTTISGDFKLKIGQIIYLKIDAISNFGFTETSHYLNGYYYITGLKHVITNSGTHETSLELSQIAPVISGLTGGNTYSYN